MPTPVLAIVGRPNVGKSTLFNRLVGRRQSIVHNQPGVTRDRIHAPADLGEATPVIFVDTGGLVPGDDPIGVNRQVLMAAQESDALLLVVDGSEGLTPADEEVWHALRPLGRPTILVVNKGDVRSAKETALEFHALGVEPVLLVSAEHGSGIGDLKEALRVLAPGGGTARELDPEAPPAIAIVGRPNVGKSSILNRLLGAERALVSAVPGTTRDPIDSLLASEGRTYRLIDTAGIRRRAKVSGTPEDLAVLLARRQAERADAVALVVDAHAGITSGDLAIAGMLWELGQPVVVVVNKWDLLEADARHRLDSTWPRLDELLHRPHRVNVSAASGRGLEKLLPALHAALDQLGEGLGTGEVNRLLESVIRAHRAPAERGKPWKMYYATQVSRRPPTFMIFANRSLPIQNSYRRYLENSLSESLGLRGVPLRLVVKRRENAPRAPGARRGRSPEG
jgi:GTP-binding protein